VFSAIDEKTLKFHTVSATPTDTNDPVAQNLGTHVVTQLFDSCFYAGHAQERATAALAPWFRVLERRTAQENCVGNAGRNTRG
jgi:hypothetical protein